MRNGILSQGIGWIAIGSALTFNVACSDDGSSDTETEILTATECTDRGGEPAWFDSCGRGRDQLGTIESEEGSLPCCETVPILTPEQCEAQGGDPLGDPGDGSSYRDGCPAGETMLGTLDYGAEGGICCK